MSRTSLCSLSFESAPSSKQTMNSALEWSPNGKKTQVALRRTFVVVTSAENGAAAEELSKELVRQEATVFLATPVIEHPRPPDAQVGLDLTHFAVDFSSQFGVDRFADQLQRRAATIDAVVFLMPNGEGVDERQSALARTWRKTLTLLLLLENALFKRFFEMQEAGAFIVLSSRNSITTADRMAVGAVERFVFERAKRRPSMIFETVLAPFNVVDAPPLHRLRRTAERLLEMVERTLPKR